MALYPGEHNFYCAPHRSRPAAGWRAWGPCSRTGLSRPLWQQKLCTSRGFCPSRTRSLCKRLLSLQSSGSSKGCDSSIWRCWGGRTSPAPEFISSSFLTCYCTRTSGPPCGCSVCRSPGTRCRTCPPRCSPFGKFPVARQSCTAAPTSPPAYEQ